MPGLGGVTVRLDGVNGGSPGKRWDHEEDNRSHNVRTWRSFLPVTDTSVAMPRSLLYGFRDFRPHAGGERQHPARQVYGLFPWPGTLTLSAVDRHRNRQ